MSELTYFLSFQFDHEKVLGQELNKILGRLIGRPGPWIPLLGSHSNKSKYIFQTRKEPFFLGIAVFLYGITFSLNTGYAINPARDLGPRLFIQLVGFPRAFTRGNDTFDNYWWIPLLGPAL